MKKLLHLYLNHNFLEGELPSELVEMSKVRDLYLEHNAFKGTISTEFALMTNLGEATAIGFFCFPSSII